MCGLFFNLIMLKIEDLLEIKDRALVEFYLDYYVQILEVFKKRSLTHNELNNEYEMLKEHHNNLSKLENLV